MQASVGRACTSQLGSTLNQRSGSRRCIPPRCAASGDSNAQGGKPVYARIASNAAAMAAAALLASSHMPAHAALPMVSSQDVTEAAKPLAKQEVQKGKVWLLLAGGSAVLFGATVALERAKLFPAIAKANEAMSANRTARENEPVTIDAEMERQWQPNDVDAWQEEEFPSTDAVLAGLQSASRRVLGDDEDSSTSTSPSTSSSVGDSSAAEVFSTAEGLEHAGSAVHAGAEAVAAGAGPEAVMDAAAVQQDESRSSLPDVAAALTSDGTAAAEAEQISDQGSDSRVASPAKSPTEVVESPTDFLEVGAGEEQAERELSPSNAAAGVEADAPLPSTAAADDSAVEPSAAAASADSHAGASEDVPQASNGAAPGILSELSSEELEALIAAKIAQQEAAKAEETQTASKRVEDLTEDELLALIATKRRMAQMAVTEQVDQKVDN